jgi:V/A-type H+-transporting ATPase subunit I
MIGLEGAVFPAVSSKIAVYVAIIGSAGIVLTGGRESSNWVKRIMKGAYALYGVTGYLGDVLSYSRLLALGLATGMIAQVFNKMGSMMGNGIAGVIVFILVFMVGQTLNFAINAMGAYVHSNRLTFVEFFGKFYNGGGHPFMPFTMNTKYIKVCNDETKAH